MRYPLGAPKGCYLVIYNPKMSLGGENNLLKKNTLGL